ncbi:hypothetical protein ACWGB8_30915 [Kitasatospora sp. NPDC054939]
MGRDIRTTAVPAADAAPRPTVRLPRTARVENAARDGVPDTDPAADRA